MTNINVKTHVLNTSHRLNTLRGRRVLNVFFKSQLLIPHNVFYSFRAAIIMDLINGISLLIVGRNATRRNSARGLSEFRATKAGNSGHGFSKYFLKLPPLEKIDEMK